MKNASSLIQAERFREQYRSSFHPSPPPAGLVYKGLFASLYFTGGRCGTYYISCSKGGLDDYLFSSKTNTSLSLEKGLAICKALDFYEKDEVRKLYSPEKKTGFITSYFSRLISRLKGFIDNEKDLIAYCLSYNESILRQKRNESAENLGFRFL